MIRTLISFLGERFSFSLYSYADRVLWMVLDVMPPFLRSLAFRMLLGRFGKNVYIDYLCYIRYPWRVEIEDGVILNRAVRILPTFQTGPGRVIIRRNAVIAPEVTFLAGGHDYSSFDLPITASDIEVGEDTWIGARCLILQGVKIGEGSIIGAGSIVSRSIPPFKVAYGSPASVRKDRVVSGKT